MLVRLARNNALVSRVLLVMCTGSRACLGTLGRKLLPVNRKIVSTFAHLSYLLIFLSVTPKRDTYQLGQILNT